ncbi:ATPase associated with various cellular activities AAA_5 [Thiorhodococcus drewsii AZ1]|uniref:ATPase associated with various cellular activities AAA_5 n=1 Tax=Thiorhodococcus drewsii AZ1 TaxID=765913 RepID=G2E6X3_9GAMM|nr:AAA family ATPase [Thiorhodococcus drewsii]EGV28135.1 ATPase associated with various cellular activities AAA_5 [Thiorhodococcus drewsii AZ1]
MTTQPFNVAQAFGVNAPKGLSIEGFADAGHPQIPPATPYVFRQGLAGIIAFLRDPVGDAFLLTGPTGSGKTSLVCQVANRLNWPVQSVTCHGRMELSDLVGQFVLCEGSTRFVHGPLAMALREGHILLLNEIDLMDPAELAGLNDVIEGQPLVIPQNGGEVIRPHPKFRVFATGNSAGAGDTTGLYQGVLRQNLAFLDRFRVLQVGYLEPEIELGVLERAVPSLPSEVGTKLIAVANEVRRLFMGEADAGAELTVTLSTRTLVRWARLALTFRGAPQPIRFALEQALTARADPEQREAIHRIAADVMGDLWLGGTPA